MGRAHDPETLAFYDREADPYARHEEGPSPHLGAFLDRLAPQARILELGCGAGRDTAAMLARGFDVDATDGSPAMTLEAEARLGRPVRRMLFEQLEAVEAYDGVWANACLLHVPEDELAGVLRRVHRALKPGGAFHASYKSGDGGGRDGLGRYYNFPTEARLLAAYAQAGAWRSLEVTGGEGRGYDGVRRSWLLVEAAK